MTKSTWPFSMRSPGWKRISRTRPLTCGRSSTSRNARTSPTASPVTVTARRSTFATVTCGGAGGGGLGGSEQPRTTAAEARRTTGSFMPQGRRSLRGARRELPELAVLFVGDDVERAVRTLAHVADAPAALGEQVLLALHLRLLEHQPDELAVLQAADEETAFPLGERLARVELRARRRDDRVPVVHGLLEARLRSHGARDRLARVLLAVRDERPAVVLPPLDEVELVAAAR